ncbi:multidrug effflux MFS transporter [Acidomonas methanolica]|uniref:Bcr/CflA family efflux transporter n=1 Tax=Acidomonas methanolica NBRC 104435 TaxID=1231351 RepID=A0A023D4I7_ACIMT|nr:multidrug effflux MFS transporter [Acidomonas methanolica]MBU2655593.1 multidrug effflux MFS transporter [Acidomonas methanolica]TCS21542.1 DHA1 family bicyclomycin/chloramphenicol resistance-like MFS transporter [Acidomonas methanolica]GAJ29083.1 multidrug resistance efflux pump Bcr/CflA [Acidomonas methanolica NBRC 104435]GBQ48145.1 multidrug ABC transporter [Acidomonas methanolica]GEL00424.1 Bcr/CflA family drug resistance efflux transporter [Acidomonas methanolica NBRC 104435]
MSFSQQSASPRTLSTGQIALLGLVSTIGPLSTDMYLPAFPRLEHDLGHGPGSAQFTLACWFAGLAVGQFCLGPLSDRFGRLWPLLLGLGVYAAASVGLAVTDSYTLFCVLRFVAAIGGSISSVVPRAIVRDVATGHEAVRIMSQLTLVFGVGPILAPTLGSALLMFGSWRLIFWSGALSAILLVGASAMLLPDTLPLEFRRHLPPVEILNRYYRLVRERVFCSAALITSFSSFVMFAYIADAPTLFERLLGFSPSAFAIFFGVNAGGFILATQINGRLTRHVSYIRIMEVGIAACLVSGLILLAVCLSGATGAADPWPLCVFIITTTFALGFIGPNATVLSLTHHGHQAASASALLGTMSFSIGGSSGLLMAFLPAHWLGSTAIGMLTGVAGMILCNFWRRSGHSAPETAG